MVTNVANMSCKQKTENRFDNIKIMANLTRAVLVEW